MASVKILRASAGSGKTYQLAYAYVREVVRVPECYRNILAVTFTNKATEEMKRRIVEEINRLASNQKSNYLNDLCSDLGLSDADVRNRAVKAQTYILHDYSRFSVLTIDKFFQRIIRAFLRELGIDINFNLELETDTLLEEAADRLIDRIATDEKLRQRVIPLVEEKMERDGKWDIRGELVALGGELFQERYKMLQSLPSVSDFLDTVNDIKKQSACIKNEMRNIASDALKIIADAGFRPEDFSYGNQGCTSYFVKIARGEITLYGNRVTDALGNNNKWVSANSPNKAALQALVPKLQPLLKDLCNAYDQHIHFLTSADLVLSNYRGFVLLQDLAQCVSELCKEQRIVPISETGSIIGKLIGGNDTPFIYEKVGNQFDHFMIDEFQDTSVQQWNNFKPLLENAVAVQQNMPALLVGDIKQSIYRWRGGDWRILGHEVSEVFENVDIRSLDTNYRSARRVVEFNNWMIECCVQVDNQRLNDLLDEAEKKGFLSVNKHKNLKDMLKDAYEGHHQQAHAAADSGYVRVVAYDKEQHQQKSCVIEVVEELQQRGYEPGDIAILVRRKVQGVAVAQQLLDYKSAHPDAQYCYDVVTQEALQIGSSSVVGFIVAVFRLVLDINDSISRAIYNRFLGWPFEQDLDPEETEFLHSLRLASIEETFEQTVMRYKLSDRTGEIAYLQAFEDQIHRFSTSRIADLSLFVAWWEESGATQSIALPQTKNAINVLTIHKSKGLQYRVVIVPDCNWGLEPLSGSLTWTESKKAPFNNLGVFPLGWKKGLLDSYFSDDSYQELVMSHIDNINLLYVAVTRAVDELYLFRSNTSKNASGSDVGNLLRQVIDESQSEKGCNSACRIEGRVEQIGNDSVFHFGEPTTLEEMKSEPVDYLTEYPVIPYDKKLSFRFDTDRYFGADNNALDGEEDSLSDSSAGVQGEKSLIQGKAADTRKSDLRSYGILMHKLFESVSSRDEVQDRLDQMCHEGAISEQEAQNLQDKIAKAWQNSDIVSWFDPQWTEVRNEHAILLPGSSDTRRPDRVLIKGSEAVVVDYKFGLHEKNAYVNQIEDYIRLLQRMGYRQVVGYLWYVELERIVKVAI